MIPPLFHAGERELYGEFDRERSLRLARIVGLVFATLLTLVLTVLSMISLLEPSVRTVFLSRVGADHCGVRGALPRGLDLHPARTSDRRGLRGSWQHCLGIAMFQATWESTHGVDIVVVAASGVYTIAVGLAVSWGHLGFCSFSRAAHRLSLGMFWSFRGGSASRRMTHAWCRRADRQRRPLAGGAADLRRLELYVQVCIS